MASMHIFFISELTKEYFTRQIFKTGFWVGEVLHGSLVQLLLEHCDFLHIDISQGSVATRLRCGGIFKYELVANLPLSLLVKDFWKLVNICGSYGQEFGVLFFLRHSVLRRGGGSACRWLCCRWPGRTHFDKLSLSIENGHPNFISKVCPPLFFFALFMVLFVCLLSLCNSCKYYMYMYRRPALKEYSFS